MQHLDKKNDTLGAHGEEIACKYLSANQYVIRHRNWHFKHKEIDIIAEKNSVLYVIEVKTRSSAEFERPQDAVSLKKQKFLISAANAYIEMYNLEIPIQFDIIHILYSNNKYTITHLSDAFYAFC